MQTVLQETSTETEKTFHALSEKSDKRALQGAVKLVYGLKHQADLSLSVLFLCAEKVKANTLPLSWKLLLFRSHEPDHLHGNAPWETVMQQNPI